jgi:RNA polymerase sigma-70 factor (ECF subfamily)
MLRRDSPREEEVAVIDTVDPGPSAERALLAREQLATVECVLGEISAQQRMAFSLRFFEEMALEEIAEAMQVELGTVKAHLFRAVRAVRKRLKEQR